MNSPQELIALIKGELINNRLYLWKGKAHISKRIFGMCEYRSQTIFISWPLAGLNTVERVLITIRHEIAHALVGPGHGHDDTWKCKAIELGSDGEAHWSEKNTVAVPPLWLAFCQDCGKLFLSDYCRRKSLLHFNCLNPSTLGRGRISWRKNPFTSKDLGAKLTQ